MPNESHPSFTTTAEAYAHDLYRHSIDEYELDAFLEETELYDSGKKEWLTPTSPTSTGDLLGSVFQMLSSIVRRFVKPTEPGVERETLNTQDIPTCQGTNDSGYRACPLVVVRATGPSFQIRKTRKPVAGGQEGAVSLGFGGMATYFVVRSESELGSEKEILDEMKSYTRCVAWSTPPTSYLTEGVQSSSEISAQPILCTFNGDYREACSPLPFRSLWVPALSTHRHS